MNLPLANYKEEQKKFQELIEDKPSKRILMLKGESGSGKTKLVEWCVDQIPSHVQYLKVQLKGNDTTAAHILYRLGRSVGWDRFKTFTRHIASLSNNTEFEDNNWLLEIRRYLDELLQAEDIEKRKNHIESITDAWFTDVRTFHSPLLLILDTYEQATEELDQWFCKYFLPWIADISSVRVLVAGQVLPDQSGDWSHCCYYNSLDGVREADAWIPIAHAMGREIPLDFLTLACAAVNGNPSKVLDFIRGLPQSHKPVTSHSNQKATHLRKHWRQNMLQCFSLLDIQEICFDLSIDFESIGDSNNLRAKILSLMYFLDNRGRLHELIERCRELRPHVDW